MNKETLNRANSIITTIDTLDKLKRVMCVPYPQFSSSDTGVNSEAFEDKTLEELKLVITNFVEKRKSELEKEFESL